jgi:hypothetical protein
MSYKKVTDSRDVSKSLGISDGQVMRLAGKIDYVKYENLEWMDGPGFVKKQRVAYLTDNQIEQIRNLV